MFEVRGQSRILPGSSVHASAYKERRTRRRPAVNASDARKDTERRHLLNSTQTQLQPDSQKKNGGDKRKTVSYPRLAASLITTALMILLTVLFSIMIQIRLSDHVWICVIALEATISLLLCPLFWDVTLYLTWFKAIRFFCVPYWLYTLI